MHPVKKSVIGSVRTTGVLLAIAIILLAGNKSYSQTDSVAKKAKHCHICPFVS